jgi:hypothetical protein
MRRHRSVTAAPPGRLRYSPISEHPTDGIEEFKPQSTPRKGKDVSHKEFCLCVLCGQDLQAQKRRAEARLSNYHRSHFSSKAAGNEYTAYRPSSSTAALSDNDDFQLRSACTDRNSGSSDRRASTRPVAFVSVLAARPGK